MSKGLRYCIDEATLGIENGGGRRTKREWSVLCIYG